MSAEVDPDSQGRGVQIRAPSRFEYDNQTIAELELTIGRASGIKLGGS